MASKYAKRVISFVLVGLLVLGAAPLSFGGGSCAERGLFIHAGAAHYDGTVAGGINWAVDTETGVLSITGSGAIRDWQSPESAPWYAYRGDISSVTFDSGITGIGDYSFSGCRALQRVSIPAAVSSIGDYVFEGCDSLKEITVDASNSSYAGAGGVLFTKDMETLVCFPAQNAALSYTVPSTVTAIAPAAFYNCSILEEITLPDSLLRIGSHAFRGCSSLVAISIPSAVSFIGEWAFAGCVRLEGAAIPMGVASVEDSLFSGCVSLRSVSIPLSVKSIGRCAFENCALMEEIDIPAAVDSIGEFAFFGCANLTSLDIPLSVSSIGDGAFEGCAKLTEITVSALNAAYESVGGVLFSKNMAELVCYPAGISAASYTIPSTVAEIAPGAFYGCVNLTSMAVPAGVETIGDSAFYGCTGLGSVTLPSSVDSIGRRAFYGCSGISEIVVPQGITDIAESTFCKCSSLESVLFPAGLNSIGNSAFSHCDSLTGVVIPTDTAKIGESAFEYCSEIGSLVIPAGVSEVGRSAFQGCTGLASVEISEGVQKIGESAFFGCSSLVIAEVPSSVTSLGSYAFRSCEDLTYVHIPPTLETIGNKILDRAESACYICSSTEDCYAKTYADANGIEFRLCTHAHVHTFIATVTTPATCTEDGLMTYTCECGESYTKVIPKSHTFGEWELVTPGTCTEGTVEKRYCQNCDYYEQRVQPSLGHRLGEWYIYAAATCTTPQVDRRDCSFCDYYEERELEYVLGHAMGTWYVTVPASCTTEGEERRDCAFCDFYETRAIEATGHEVADKYVSKEPTCVADGEMTLICKTCGEKWTQPILATHIYDENSENQGWVRIKEPTCTEDGYERRDCMRCEHYELKVIPSNGGHSFVEDVSATVYPTCTTVGSKTFRCIVCGYSYNEELPTEHAFSNWIVNEQPTCLEAGKEWRVCTRCGDEQTRDTSPLGHSIGEWYVATEPTCTEPGVGRRNCARCDYYQEMELEALGHDMGDYYDVVAPTCTQSGVCRSDCERCEFYDVRQRPALGHSFGEWYTVTDATETQPGSEGRDCAVCSEHETRSVPPLGPATNTITAVSSQGGVISPPGATTVGRQDNVTYTIAASQGYILTRVLVDGKSVGAASTYTFIGVTANHTISAVFTPVTYIANFKVNGVTMARVNFTMDMESIEAPAVPEKPMYIGSWEEFELEPRNMNINAVYTPAPLSNCSVSIDEPDKSSIKLGDEITLTTDIPNLPSDAVITWSVSGVATAVKIAPSSNGRSCTVTAVGTGKVVITVEVADQYGNSIETSQELRISSSFWQRLIAFLKSLFGISSVAVQAFKVL